MKKKISLILTFFLTISLLTACRKEIESIPYEEESTIYSEIIIDGTWKNTLKIIYAADINNTSLGFIPFVIVRNKYSIE